MPHFAQGPVWLGAQVTGWGLVVGVRWGLSVDEAERQAPSVWAQRAIELLHPASVIPTRCL
ncbi:hypothetical protein [Streptomyces sp. NBC_00211]|uniref:hypothetical protein n=1 Tax=Streptomyces sp. NBC_00211 TaxID=2975683 RepID=UPI003255B760